jgi:protein-S-isoprenylcysteine O-methyltransferase Ste14
MADDAVFRWVMLAGFVAVVGIVAPHRVKAGTREKLDRRKEGVFMLATLRPAGAALWLGVIAYMINPAWMAWSAMALPSWLRWSGIGFFVLAVALLTWTLPALGTNLTDTVVTRKHHTLVTGGPYRWIRHPFYDAMVLITLGSALIAANWFMLVSGAVVFALLAVRSRVEEEQLAARFGDAYRDYRNRTGRFLPKLRG